MLSIPPAMTHSAWPNWIVWAAAMTAFIPDEHTLFTVHVMVVDGKPAPIAACLAGAWPIPPCSTHPMTTSDGTQPSLRFLEQALRSARHALITAEPSWGAVSELRAPWKLPIGVLLAATINTSSYEKEIRRCNRFEQNRWYQLGHR